MRLPTERLAQWLPALKKANAQNEYYLTDLISVSAKAGVSIDTMQPGHEVMGGGAKSASDWARARRT